MGFKIKETTHIKSSVSSSSFHDLNDAFQDAINNLGDATVGSSVRIEMVLEIERVG